MEKQTTYAIDKVYSEELQKVKKSFWNNKQEYTQTRIVGINEYYFKQNKGISPGLIDIHYFSYEFNEIIKNIGVNKMTIANIEYELCDLFKIHKNELKDLAWLITYDHTF